jgi:hypothetical protein
MNDSVLNVLHFIKEEEKKAQIDMFDPVDVSGLRVFARRTGNGLIARSGERISFDNKTISRGTKRLLKLLQVCGHRYQITEDMLIMDSLYPEHEIIIITLGESLTGFAPVFTKKTDLENWLADLAEWHCGLSAVEQRKFAVNLKEMCCLAEFLYRNNPLKTA